MSVHEPKAGPWLRIRAVAVEECRGLVRQTELLSLLLASPVLIMAVFGLSLNITGILLPRAAVVVEPNTEGAGLFGRFRAGQGLHRGIRIGGGTGGGSDRDA